MKQVSDWTPEMADDDKKLTNILIVCCGNS